MRKSKKGRKSGSRQKRESAKSQIRALRRAGRKIAKKAGIKPFAFSGKVTHHKKRKVSMARKHHSKRKSGRKSVVVYQGGMEGIAGRRRHRRRGRSFLHGMGLGKASEPMQSALLTVAGAVGGSFGAKYIPLKNAKIKSAILAAVGILGAMMMRQPIIKGISTGIAVAGGLGLVKNVAGVDVYAGIDDDQLSSEIDDIVSGMGGEHTSLTGEMTNLLGYDLSGTDLDQYSGDDAELMGSYGGPRMQYRTQGALRG